jgi:hypothetical protein
VAAYAITAYKQWKAIEKQANHASEQVSAMEGQLNAMREALRQNERANANQQNVMQLQARAMVNQVEIMSKSLEQTRNMVEQNERSVKAAEESARVARHAFDINQRPVIVVESAHIEPRIAPNIPLSALITIANAGPSPVQDLSITAEVARQASFMPLGFLKPERDALTGSPWPPDTDSS